ncbi:glycosyltransferase family 4 protein [Desulfonatronum thiodismutans]|uniref:glycosyltransferase family 4 protein n=1 Tax=Desulfonatronum thiodismutans TaxID=159290 RepID=UPI0004ABEE7D|nr:glycosyltransferase family 4 protein [Desulfonatronum thiodismutans]
MKNKEKVIRLLFLSDHLGYSKGVTHGATTYFLNVLHLLPTAGIDLRVCFLRNRHTVAEKLEERGIFPMFLDRGKWDPRALSDLVKLIKKHDINMVHAAGMKGILLGRTACRICGCKFIMHLHDTSVPGPLFRFLHRSMAGWTDRCLAISKAVGELARSEFGLHSEQVIVLYNGIDLGKAANPSLQAREKIRRKFAIPEDSPVVGVVGRLSPEKGQEVLISEIPRLLTTHPKAILLLVGDGPTRLKCESLAAELGIIHAIRFCGHRTDIPDILAAIDVLAIPSLKEGLSFSAIEAMASGRPVAAFRVGGLPELIDQEQTGLLAPEHDAPGLVDQIRRLLDDEILAARIVVSARAFACKFSVTSHVESLLDIYQAVLSESQVGERNAR